MDRDPNDLSTPSTSSSPNGGKYGGTPSAIDRAEEKLADVREAASEKLADVRHLASEKLYYAREAAGDKMADVQHAASEKIDDARDAASVKMENVRHATSEKIHDAREVAGEKLESTRDAAKVRFDDAREQLADGAEAARKWKRTAEQKLADRLHDGATRLRDRADNNQTPGRATPAYVAAAADGMSAAGAAVADRAQSVEHTIARGMDATAEWLKDGDIQTTVKEQARTNPVRTVLVALGVGYLLGKLLKR